MDEQVSPSRSVNFITRFLEELGLVSVYRSTLDTKLLISQRFVRLFAYGGSTLILVSYLKELGISDTNIGLFMTLTLIGDVIISFILTTITDSIGRKWMLALGAILMTLSGGVFALASNYWILLAAAVLGIISPSGNEIGPFRAIEESTLAHLCSPQIRPDVFAWYSVIGSAGTAFGMLTCGWVVRALEAKDGWDIVKAYRVVFLAYSTIGLSKLLLALSLSPKCEAKPEPQLVSDSEEAPLLDNHIDGAPQKVQKQRKPLFPHISKKSRSIFVKLAILFALDSFASSLAALSWITNFFKRKFHLQEGYLGSLFFTTSIIAAISVLIAASLARRFGNVKIMVFTHLPSSIALALLGIPGSLPVAMTLLVFRACTQSMDVAPRSAFLAAIILPNERTAVMGAMNVMKTGAQSLGPIITGVLVNKNLFWVAFLIAGSLKAIYDVSLLAVFLNHESREDENTLEDDVAASG
ncbi:MFS general substrate transporter [Delitschia confertaspora ATCC 74209]|uniref:MFS general substrate transporter n=1 Tax=Delitschia confertaspora ATCC 74209 TaxID=1513339 RepID=A0A9P4JZE5_9PLEO|nr:MFS general substrate transporter [Delitschia confertaspora ATCC 74209]